MEDGLEEMVRRFIVTAAVRGAKPNHEFLASLNKYAKANDVENIYVLPMLGCDIGDRDIDEVFYDSNYEVVNSNKQLNKNIMINKFNVLQNQIDPVTGLARFAQDNKSSIFAATKQRMKVIPNSSVELPKVIMTTGACTLPHYRDNRIGNIARMDHLFGAVVVEVEDNKHYHFRQIQSQKNGIFYDLSTKYNGNKKPVKKRPEAMVLGDLHFGDTDRQAYEETKKMIEEYKPKKVFLHDVFNGHSINHHEDGHIIDKYKMHKSKGLDLEKELKMVGDELYSLAEQFPKTKFYVVKSNHDLFLERYLNEGRFVKEPQNALVSSELLASSLKGKDPLKEGLDSYWEHPKNIKFISEEEDHKVYGWELGRHGNRGPNGGRGSIRSIEFCNGKSISAHSHTPEIFRNVYKVGTLTKLRLPYTKGPSSWLHTNAMLYDNGRAQLVNIVDGRHKI